MFLFAIALFFASIVTDWIWAHWAMATADRKAAPAGFWAAAIMIMQLVNWNAFHKSYWYVIPLATGCAVGTYVTVKRDKQKQELNDK